MCGIYGMVGASAGEIVPRMSAALVHRGPDADGATARNGAMLGCRRLAIVDVAGGAQPVTNESGDVVAVCNGEIYNHAALRRELIARGHRFRTSSDAEVVPHLYEERGPAFVDALDGMFGIAVWDVCAAATRPGSESGRKQESGVPRGETTRIEAKKMGLIWPIGGNGGIRTLDEALHPILP